MATKPADLTSKTWNKLKELTVPKTGFGAKLDAFLLAKKDTELLRTRNLAAYQAATTALDAAQRHVAVAQGKCNKVLHKATIKLLDVYDTMLATEEADLKRRINDYNGYIAEAMALRKTCATEMAAHKVTMENTGKQLVTAIKAALAKNNKVMAGEIAQKGLAQLNKLQAAANESLQKPRTANDRPAEEKASPDDLGGADGFTKLIKMQEEVIGIRKHYETKISDAMAAALGKAPEAPVKT